MMNVKAMGTVADKMADNSKKKRLSFYWNERGILKVKRDKQAVTRKAEIPPRSWFYESGGISPIPVYMPNLDQVIVDLNSGQDTEAEIEFRPSDEEENEGDENEPKPATSKFEKRELNQSVLEKRNKNHEPFSFIAIQGDQCLNHSSMIPVFRENFLCHSELISLRNQLRMAFAQHYEVWSSKCLEYCEKEVNEKTELFNNELKLKLKLHSKRWIIINFLYILNICIG